MAGRLQIGTHVDHCVVIHIHHLAGLCFLDRHKQLIESAHMKIAFLDTPSVPISAADGIASGIGLGSKGLIGIALGGLLFGEHQAWAWEDEK